MNGYYILFPDWPEIKITNKDLKDIEFPLSFRICVSEIDNSYERYTDHGYTHDFAFFNGESSYNSSLIGWNGHTQNGSTIGPLRGLNFIRFNLYKSCIVLLDILSNVSYEWKSIIKEIEVYSTDGLFHDLSGDNLSTTWDDIQFPSCRTIDLSKNFDMVHVPKQLFLIFHKLENHAISIYILDKKKVLRRPLKVAMLDYSGPSIAINDLNLPKSERIMLSISQFIDSEFDENKKCMNYPNKTFKSYALCDEKFVYNQFKTKFSPIMPFWVTRNLREVTALRYIKDKCFSQKNLF